MPDTVPNNTSTTATISVGGTVQGVIDTAAVGSTPGDHDWYSIHLNAGQEITISLFGSGSNPLPDAYVDIRDSSGNVLGSNDDSGGSLNSKLVFTATTTGTYYIDAGGYDSLSSDWNPDYATPNNSGNYTLSVQPYTPPPVWTYDQIANQLTTGYWAANGTVGHPFNVTQGGSITVNYSSLTAAEQALAIAALQEWSDIIGVTFTPVTTGGQIRFIDTEDSSDPGPIAQTEWMNTYAQVQISSSWVTGRQGYGTSLNSYSFQTYVHEIGHALGLGHAGDYNTTADYTQDALFANDAWSTSVMSYFSQTDNAYFANQGFTEEFVLTPMDADIVAMQQLYGLSTTTRTGDTVYGFHSNTGNGVYNASYMLQNSPTGTAFPSYAIFDSGGNDTLDYSGFNTNQLINLNPETFSNVGPNVGNSSPDVGNVTIARGTIIENAIGGGGNDTIIGNSVANVLTGGAGTDTLTGGAGNDTFKDTMSGLNGDTITDFSAGDNIVFTNATLSSFTFSVSGMTLNYNGMSLHLGSAPAGTITASAAAGGGVQLLLNSIAYGYDDQGRLISEDVYNSDGSHSFVSIDASNTESWTQQWFNYDSQARLVSEDVRNDNGSHTFITVDAAQAQTWSQVWLSYDPQGRLTSEDVRNDDGSHTFIAVDASGTQNWFQDWLNYDAQGRLTSEDVRYDDGSHTFITVDAAQTQTWSQEWLSYDSQGRLTSEDVRNDDGSHTFIAVDTSGTQNWFQEWLNYDAQGRLTSEDVRYDDGSHTFITVDSNNSQPWTQVWFNYGVQGDHLNEATVWDDGHVTYSAF